MPHHIALLTTHNALVKELKLAIQGLIDARCLRDVAIHAQRPVLAAAAVVAGYEWPPRPVLPETCAELHMLVDEMTAQIDLWLRETPDARLLGEVTLRWGTFPTGTEALINSLAHGLVHVGAIRGIRALGGFPLPPE